MIDYKRFARAAKVNQFILFQSLQYFNANTEFEIYWLFELQNGRKWVFILLYKSCYCQQTIKNTVVFNYWNTA